MKKKNANSPFNIQQAQETRKQNKAAKAEVGLELGWTRKQAILAKCGECSNFNKNEVKHCPCESCPLYPFRNRKPLTPVALKKWEEDYMACDDGKKFLKMGDSDEDPVEDCEPTASAEAVEEFTW